MSDSFQEDTPMKGQQVNHDEENFSPETAEEQKPSEDPQVENPNKEVAKAKILDNSYTSDEHSPHRNADESDYATSPESHQQQQSHAAGAGRNAVVTPPLGNEGRTSATGGKKHSPARSGAGSRNESRLPPIGSSTDSIRRSHQPLVATISYPPRQEGLTVADFLDPSKPLVKSTQPLTKPKGPSFVEEQTFDERKQRHAESRMQAAITSSQIQAQRDNERKYLKAQYEFEREKKIAEKAIYHKERCMQWSQRLGASPLAVDLVADNERIEEEAYIREKEERHRQTVAERRKQRIKKAIIVKALAEVPLLEKARKEKRDLVEGEKREKALRDVQRVEAIQQRKLLDQELMIKERQAKLDQRIMSSSR